MVTRCRPWACLALVAAVVVSLSACNIAKLRATRSFNQANERYAAKQYRDAIPLYEVVLEEVPAEDLMEDEALSTVWFFLGNSYDNLYRPAMEDDPENQRIGESAVENYQLASERAKNPEFRQRALQYLFEMYGPDKMNRPDEAEEIGKTLIAAHPDDPLLYVGLARLYRDTGDPESAVATLEAGLERSRDNESLIGELVDTYDRAGDFDNTIVQVERLAALNPNDPAARLRPAQYLSEWVDKHPTLTDAQRREYIERGLEATDHALEARPDYLEAFVYKRILLFARVEVDGKRDRKTYDQIMSEIDEVTEQIDKLMADPDVPVEAEASEETEEDEAEPN